MNEDVAIRDVGGLISDDPPDQSDFSGDEEETASYTPTLSFAAVRGVRRMSPAAARFQGRIAGLVVLLPLLGTIYAFYQVCVGGVGPTELCILAGMYFLCTIGATVGFHRLFTHRAFKAHPAVKVGLAALGSMAAQGPLVFWVAEHRRHHLYSDRIGDPHSPNLHGGGLKGLFHGLYHAHLGWMFSDEQSDWANYAKDIVRDRDLFQIHQTYFRWVLLGLLLPAALGGLLTRSWLGAANGLLWGGLVRMFVLNQASWCVGSVCHVFGTRPFDTRDRSGNCYSVALLTFGEGLQNNHHAFQNSAAHGLKWWEPDLSMLVIRALAALGLVWDVRVPTPEAIRAARRSPA